MLYLLLFRRWMCDFENDCGDNSDETEAVCKGSYRPCSESEFKCANGRCIPQHYRCDHDDDCVDGSDEVGCSNFQCKVTGHFNLQYITLIFDNLFLIINY